MKRDMDLIRQILLAARECQGPLKELPGVEQATFDYQVGLLNEAGFVVASVREDHGVFKTALLWRLTWSGEDFACSLIDDTLWKKAKEAVLKPTASWTFDVLKAYLSSEISRRLSSDI
ncbi:MAG: DUF2513 domain-containing protein [Burkholderiaceae bacterium]